MRPRPSALALLLCVGLACGDDGSGRDSDTGASGSPSSPSGVSITTPTGSGSGSDTDVTDGTAGTEGESDSGATASSSSSDPSDPTLTTSSSDPTLTSDPTVTTTDTTGEPCMGGEQGELESFLWIANSGEDTVSKIDTKSGVELGRYRTRPEAGGSPSRTSVNTADAVAVANRLGGVAAFHAQTSHCKETNGVPGIQTSSGPGDVRPWGEDECLIWYAPFSYNDNRPVAWTSGYLNLDTCEVEDRNVWTAGSNTALGTAEVVLIDGESGSVLQTIPIPELPEAWPGWFGFYGGAVDAAQHRDAGAGKGQGGLEAGPHCAATAGRRAVP